MISFYQYIAHNEPNAAMAVCNKYGYSLQDVQSEDDLAKCLMDLVAQEGTGAVYELAKLHPDKELILEMAGQTSNGITPSAAAPGGCAGCAEKKAAAEYVQKAGGATETASWFAANQGSLLIIGGVIIITLAILNKKN